MIAYCTLVVQTFATPNSHPKSKPFVDHVFSFTILDGRIWFRNYQIAWKEKGKLGKGAKDIDPETNLVEVGPRFTLCPIRVFEGTFGGPTLYENPDYISPNVVSNLPPSPPFPVYFSARCHSLIFKPY